MRHAFLTQGCTDPYIPRSGSHWDCHLAPLTALLAPALGYPCSSCYTGGMPTQGNLLGARLTQGYTALHTGQRCKGALVQAVWQLCTSACSGALPSPQAGHRPPKGPASLLACCQGQMHAPRALGASPPPTHCNLQCPCTPPADTWEWPVLLLAGPKPRTRHTLSTLEGGTQRMCAACIVH
jgi:hypothetical protein